MNAPAVNTTPATPILDDDIASVGDWRELVVLQDRRLARMTLECRELRARLSILTPLLDDWPEHDKWAAAAREYHANRQRRPVR
jgi:hypothetical protein